MSAGRQGSALKAEELAEFWLDCIGLMSLSTRLVSHAPLTSLWHVLQRVAAVLPLHFRDVHCPIFSPVSVRYGFRSVSIDRYLPIFVRDTARLNKKFEISRDSAKFHQYRSETRYRSHTFDKPRLGRCTSLPGWHGHETVHAYPILTPWYHHCRPQK